MSSLAVIRATPADDSRLVRALVRAYHDDPIMNWAFPAPPRRDEAWALYFQLMLELYHPHGGVLTTENRAGFALWAPPHKWRVERRQELAHAPTILRMLGLRRLPRGLRVMHRMQREHPPAPHYYLNLLGVDPDHQNRGVGSALVRAGLVLADRDGVGAYLETSNARNLSLYRRHGFNIVKSFNFGADGPRYWLLWRDPRPAP